MLLRREADAEASVVEVDHVVERRREAVVEVGRARRQARRIGPLNLPMSAHLPVISARPGSVVCTVAPVVSVAQRVERQVGRAPRRRGEADVDRQRAPSDCRRWACRGRSCRCRRWRVIAELVVEPVDAGDGDRLGVEERLAARDCAARAVGAVGLAGRAAPAVVEVKTCGVERRRARRRIAAEHVVDAEMEGDGGEDCRAAVALLGGQVAGVVVGGRGGEQRRLEAPRSPTAAR